MQCVWWLASVLGLEPGVVAHIDILQNRGTKATSGTYGVQPERIHQVQDSG
jgi:hypothetical protein